MINYDENKQKDIIGMGILVIAIVFISGCIKENEEEYVANKTFESNETLILPKNNESDEGKYVENKSFECNEMLIEPTTNKSNDKTQIEEIFDRLNYHLNEKVKNFTEHWTSSLGEDEIVSGITIKSNKKCAGHYSYGISNESQFVQITFVKKEFVTYPYPQNKQTIKGYMFSIRGNCRFFKLECKQRCSNLTHEIGDYFEKNKDKEEIKPIPKNYTVNESNANTIIKVTTCEGDCMPGGMYCDEEDYECIALAEEYEKLPCCICDLSNEFEIEIVEKEMFTITNNEGVAMLYIAPGEYTLKYEDCFGMCSGGICYKTYTTKKITAPNNNITISRHCCTY